LARAARARLGTLDDVAAIHPGDEAAKAVTDRPSLIKVPPRSATASPPNKPTPPAVQRPPHSGAMRAELTRTAAWELELRNFEVPQAAYDHWREAISRGAGPPKPSGPPPGHLPAKASYPS